MIVGVDLNETCEYTSQFDKGELKTIFVIKTLTNKDKIALLQSAVNKETGELDANLLMGQAKEIFKNGVKEIRNLIINKKTEASDYREITDDIVDALPLMIVNEVAGKVAEFNFLSHGEEKN